MHTELNKRGNKATVTGLMKNYKLVIRRVGERWATGEIISNENPDYVFAFTFPSSVTTLQAAINLCERGIPLLTAEAERLFDKHYYTENPKLKYDYRVYGSDNS